MKSTLIAKCGMNCNICSAHLRTKNHCPGCKFIDPYEKSYKRKCIIRSCPNNLKFCSDKCDKYPCRRLKNLDKRYTTKYNTSLIQNLEKIKNSGIREFIKKEKSRWIKGNKIFNIHKKQYEEIQNAMLP